MARISWSKQARADFRRLIAIISEHQTPRIATEWARRIEAAVDILKKFPEIGSPVEDTPFPGLREQIVGRYRVIYKYNAGVCRIVIIPRAEQDLSNVLLPEDVE